MPSTLGIYVRVSRQGEREDERFHSPREQVERATSLAIAKGYAPGPVFEDINVSGAVAPKDRPAMSDLLRAIEAGELAGIAAYSLDRLSRDPGHGDVLVKRVTKAGGVVLTPDIPDAIDSPTGEFTFGMLLQVAKLYRSQAGARFASAKERSIREGIPVGFPAIGYRIRADRKLEVDPDMAPVVRELFERWAAGGGRSTLADWLEERTGRKWSRQAVPAIIKNRLYATGRMQYGDQVSEWDAGTIVDEALWQAAQRTPAPKRPPRSDGGWLLTGLGKCAACGMHLNPSVSQGKYRSYRCVNRHCDARAYVRAERLERFVELRAFATVDEVLTKTNAPDLGALEDTAALAERRLAQVMAPEARDALGDLWAADVKARRAEHADALAALGQARQDAGVGAAPAMFLPDVYEGLDIADKRAALGLLWKVIRVGRKGPGGLPVTFVARGPHGEAEVALGDVA